MPTSKLMLAFLNCLCFFQLASLLHITEIALTGKALQTVKEFQVWNWTAWVKSLDIS
jgi:hypothetical protein